MEKNPTCEERIDTELDRVAEVFLAYRDDPHEEDIIYEGSEVLGLPELGHYGLSFSYHHEDGDRWGSTYWTYLLSWGGPSDEIRFYPGGTITYHFMDWFDGAMRDVTNEEWAQWLSEWLGLEDGYGDSWARARETYSRDR